MSEENFVPISITIEPAILKLLDKVAEEKHSSRSDILRQSFGLYLKELVKTQEPLAGVFVDGSGNMTFVGLATEQVVEKVKTGEWKLIRSF
jgi:hypothetical protein